MNKELNNLLESPLDHIAIAVSDLDQSQKFYESLGIDFLSQREKVESENVEVAFGKLGQAKLELLKPLEDKVAIQKFLEKKGPGLHHICFRVSDIQQKQKSLEENGIRFIYKKAKTGAGGHLVNFIHPQSAMGVLIELSEKV